MDQTTLVLGLLAGLLALALASVVSVLLGAIGKLTRQQTSDRAQIMSMTASMMELTSIRYVRDHLREYGVAPYMVSASERLNRDIAEVQATLQVSEDEAVEYLRQGIRGTDDRQHSDGKPPGEQ